MIQMTHIVGEERSMTTGINLNNGTGIPELTRFQEHFSEYRIAV
jgi:hypothetical protein